MEYFIVMRGCIPIKNTDKIAVYISMICNVYTNGTAGIIGVVPDIPFYKINTSYRMIYE